jgi:GH15 family glucan-1,4-alpha-glucosidase
MNQLTFIECYEIVENYIDWELKIDYTTSNRGEPKFNVDGSKFTEPWGRPQNDGPALRVITMIRWFNILLDNNKSINKNLYSNEHPSKSIIKNDLEYIADNWRNMSFDLWEEVNDWNYFTLNIQQYALYIGSTFAIHRDDTGASTHYLSVSNDIKRFLNFFTKDGYINSHITGNKTNNLDTSIIIANILSNSSSINSELITTITMIVTKFKKEYSINNTLEFPLIGRYPNDLYFTGNPWILTSLYLAAILYKLSDEYTTFIHSDIKLQLIKLLELFNLNVTDIKTDLKLLADRYLDMIYDIGNTCDWTEQISNYYVKGVSVTKLTWNYSAFITAYKYKLKCENN